MFTCTKLCVLFALCKRKSRIHQYPRSSRSIIIIVINIIIFYHQSIGTFLDHFNQTDYTQWRVYY